MTTWKEIYIVNVDLINDNDMWKKSTYLNQCIFNSYWSKFHNEGYNFERCNGQREGKFRSEIHHEKARSMTKGKGESI